MRAALALPLLLIVAGCVTPEPVQLDDLSLPAPAPALTTALHALGHSTFEPTLGTTSDGSIFYAATAQGVAIGRQPLVLRSSDGGVTWEDVSPRITAGLGSPPETNDPYVYVDPSTDRVFNFPMAPILVCSVLSWSDNGGTSWTTNPRGCGNTPPWDHQSMVAAKPRAAPTVGYPNVLHQCANNLVASSCARSLDGGWTWTPGVNPFPRPQCNGGLHGHLVAHPDGTVFLPKNECAKQMVAITRDDGLTWQPVVVSDKAAHSWPDPAMAVDAAGNVYFAFIGETGELLFSASTDGGSTWSEAIVVSPPGLTTHLPAMAAGDDGNVVLAFPATPDLPKGYDSSEKEAEAARWYAYFTVITNAAGEAPLAETVRASPEGDPLVRGQCGPLRCPGMTDFIDVVIGPDGRVYAAFVDVCSEDCATKDDGKNDQNEALLAVLERTTPFLTAPAAE